MSARTFSPARRWVVAGRALIAAGLGLGLASSLGCRAKTRGPPYQLVPVGRRNIHVGTSASGFIQPDTIVAVRPLTSGEVVALLADEGQLVHEGTVIARIDRRIPKSALAEARAAADVAKQQLEQAETSLRRSEQLWSTRAITLQERDSVALVVTAAKATAVEAGLTLSNAKIALDNTDVRAPITGTVLSRAIERGQIVSSPSGDVGGGTLMFQIADLTHIQARTRVDETDIGRLKPGIPAAITVPAYPGRTFDGHVLKLEPLADTVNSVTMYPVLVRVEDPNHLLIRGCGPTSNSISPSARTPWRCPMPRSTSPRISAARARATPRRRSCSSSAPMDQWRSRFGPE